MKDKGIQIFTPLRRIMELQRRLRDACIDAVLLNYSKSVYYCTGTTQPSFLIISPDDYQLLIMKGIEHVPRETWLPEDKISQAEGGFKSIADLLKKRTLKGSTLGMELDVLPADLYLRMAQVLSQFKIVDVSKIIREQRKIKDQEELSHLREASRILHQGHERILKVLREGMTELELSSEIEDAHRRAGHEGQYFGRQFDFFMGRGVLASGENLSLIAGKIQSITGAGLSSAIPMGASARKINKGDMVVVDIPTLSRGYHSDQSRTYVIGKAPASCRDLYQGMRLIADQTIEFMKPGVTCNDVYEKSVSVAREIGMEHYYLKIGGDFERLSFVGHGVGLEVNELPMLSKGNSDVIQAGTVATVEIEMWKSDKEVVKVEDTIAVHSDGAEILTISPRDLQEV